MIKKTITYIDYNGNQRTEDFYFNLTKAELMRMELGVKGGMTEMMNRMIAAQDAPAMMEVFDDLVCKSYGVKTPDGRGFVKRPEDFEAFKSTEAYSELFVELITNPDACAEFFNGVVPANLAEQVKVEQAKQSLIVATN